ncbi:prolipoprotein diacylglyceryl transferase [Fonticella tunisiensis]|uniref:Phosphatidylglycerol--prolipoprotein diacylglyceryl transferase n=1 Tax=Fonticella tunisiensis TaxID=1096341 RepID=A0A4R7KUA5_9CLOT|nr:prolipoprotein diacylglyceryl transferase [Fonticella tunisiensis]TDT63653.1 phosphatidylglycerol:prolipoprotein diacylglycerol transferase [Fonticella tunisiensis]
MVELFKIGHFSIYLFGVTIALGMLAGIFIMSREAKRKGLNADKMFDLALYTILAAILGARLYYIIAFAPGYYLKNPGEIIKINAGGLSIQGGLIGGILFALWYTKKKEISFWRAADAFAPGIALGQAIGRIGCDVFGIPMKKIYPWGIKVSGQILHPAQMYEMILDLILFTYLRRRRGKIKYNGELFIKYIIGFSINRAVVEIFRTNPIVINPLTIAQVTSIAIIIIALFVNRFLKSRSEILQEDVANNTVEVPIYQYLLILALAAAGMWFYYYIH